MYISGRRVQKPKKRYRVLKVTTVFVIVFGAIAALLWFLSRPSLVKDESDGAVRSAKLQDVPKKHITENYYEFDVPSDWKEKSRKTYPYSVITWEGKARESIGRSLDIYVDTIPDKVYVNRLIPIAGAGDHLDVDKPSPNCATFQNKYAKLKPVQTAKLKPVKMKWLNVEFICDLPNELREVMGASSTEGLNQVTVTGAKQGKHRYYFVYTDHGSHQDDSVFPAILRSFHGR